jgi:hypothetical protein
MPLIEAIGGMPAHVHRLTSLSKELAVQEEFLACLGATAFGITSSTFGNSHPHG